MVSEQIAYLEEKARVKDLRPRSSLWLEADRIRRNSCYIDRVLWAQWLSAESC